MPAKSKKTTTLSQVVPDVKHPLLSSKEAAAYLGLSEATLRAWRSRGTGPRWFRVGARAIRYRAEDLAAFLRPGR